MCQCMSLGITFADFHSLHKHAQLSSGARSRFLCLSLHLPKNFVILVREGSDEMMHGQACLSLGCLPFR